MQGLGDFDPAPELGTMACNEWDVKTCNTITGEKYPLCPCHESKFFNDHPAECELNKFDDVMDLLYKTVEGFGQIVSVDTEFEIFSRAWCVAELIKADGCGMP